MDLSLVASAMTFSIAVPIADNRSLPEKAVGVNLGDSRHRVPRTIWTRCKPFPAAIAEIGSMRDEAVAVEDHQASVHENHREWACLRRGLHLARSRAVEEIKGAVECLRPGVGGHQAKGRDGLQPGESAPRPIARVIPDLISALAMPASGHGVWVRPARQSSIRGAVPCV